MNENDKENTNKLQCALAICGLALSSISIVAFIIALVYSKMATCIETNQLILCVVSCLILATVSIVCIICYTVIVCKQLANKKGNDDNCHKLLLEAYDKIITLNKCKSANNPKYVNADEEN